MATDKQKTPAQVWVDRGWRVFPCKADKAPATAHGFHDASDDASRCDGAAMIGGVPASAGLVVLDIDTRHGGSLTDLDPSAIETRRHRTMSGGYHLIFKARPGAKYGNGPRPDIAPGMDIRHADGYVILPPSPGYTLDHNVEPLDAPSWLEAPADMPAKSRALPADGEPIAAGQQGETLFTLARGWLKLHTPDEAVALVWHAMQTRCVDQDKRNPWREHDAKQIVASAVNYVPDDTLTKALRSGSLADYDAPPPTRGKTVPIQTGLSVVDLDSIDRRNARFVPGMRMLAPRGTITVLTGQQGTGKGLMLVREAVGVAQKGGAVLIASDEDSVAYTIRPRVEAACGDDTSALKRIKMVAGLTLPEHVEDLVKLAQQLDVRLLIIDPWTNHVGNIDIDKGQELRAALMGLAGLCERADMVAILVAHPNKNSENPDPLERVAHSSALTQVARSAFWIVRDPRTDDEDARLVAHVKHNLTARAPTIMYSIDTVMLNAPVQTVPVLTEVDTDPIDWLEIHKLRKQRESARPAPAQDNALQWLLDHLHEHGATSRRHVLPLLDDAGITAGSLDRAVAKAKRDGVIDGADGVWTLGPSAPRA